MKTYAKVLLCLCVLLAIACSIKEYHNNITVYHNNIGFEINNNVQPWNLILVNKWNSMPENYSPDLITTENGEKIDATVYTFLSEMFEVAEREGYQPELTSGYRSEKEQEKLFNGRVSEYRELGFSKTEATSLALEYAAKPGYSEHETGLAVDINSKDGDSRELYNWLEDNAHKYGFILRYPAGKEDITAIEYEPWHFRFVGTEAAEYIYHNDMTLEEYLLR